MLAGVLLIFLRDYLAAVVTSVGGAISLLISYMIAQNKFNGFELKVGAYLALLSFAATAFINFNKLSEKKVAESESKG